MIFDFVKFSNDVIEPTKSTPDSAGFDLYSTENILVAPSIVEIINTCIGFKIPCGYFGKIYARSSFAVKFTDVGAGIVDADYRGLVCVVFFSISRKILLKLKKVHILRKLYFKSVHV